MVDNHLIINPTMRIFHDRGTFFAGWQPMDKSSVALSEADFVLLDVVANPVNRADLENVLRQKARSYLSQDHAISGLIRRVDELIAAEVLMYSRDMAQIHPASPEPESLKKLQKRPAKTRLFVKKRMQVTRNFMLQPVATGFQTWSPVSKRHYVLSLDLVLILVNFSSGKVVKQFLAERTRQGNELPVLATIKWLHRQGFLVTSKGASSRPWEFGASGVNVVANAGSSIKPGKTLALNGRVPIYFVPHMPNHYPLALGMMYSFISSYSDGALLKKYLPLPIVFQDTPQDFLSGPYYQYGQGIWLFSNYMWSIALNLTISAAIKKHDPRNITIHGGPSTPSYELACSKFMTEHQSVDIAVHGEGEFTIVDLLDALCPQQIELSQLHRVNGITFRSSLLGANDAAATKFTRNAPRPRIQDLDVLPSPYLTGAFDHYEGSVDAAIVESNRGCPFSCTFCDWGSATNQKIRKFELQRVKDEIEWIGKNKIRVLWVADANFGIYERDIDITDWICRIKSKYGYPKEVVVNYTKNATKRLAKIVELLASNGICSQGIISIQTRDRFTLEVINRQNIKTDKYDDLAEIFRVEGLPLSTDLMIGLPGMTVESFKTDLQYFFDKDVSVKAYPTQLLPNSPMAHPDYMDKYKIKVDSNNFLVSTFSYSRDDLHRMNVLYYLFTIADGFSTLRYVLRYLQWDHGILAIDFLHKMLDVIERDPYRYPSLAYMSKVFQHFVNMPGGWHQFYNEVAAFAEETYGVQRDSAFDSVLYFNEIVMPDDALSYPLYATLDHDIPAYFRDHNLRQSAETKPLITYPPAKVNIEDRFFYGHINYNSQQYDAHQTFWELQSPVSRIQSVPNFM